MEVLDSLEFWQWFTQVVVVFFLVGGLTGVAVGIGLIVNSSRTFQVFATVNRWISLRTAAKPLEVPRDTRAAVRKHRRWLAAAFIAGGAFSVFVLAARYDPDAIVYSLKLGTVHPIITSIGLAAVRWTLLICNLAAIAVGVLLAFYPEKVEAIENRAGRWVSERRILKGGDTMHLPLDRLVAAAPRAAGVAMIVGSVVVLASVGVMLVARG